MKIIARYYMVIRCVTIENNHLFAGNLICGQHKLRYNSIIERQNWNVPEVNQMEYDQYDNPATTYLIAENKNKQVIGVTRLYPTTRPFMLKEVFSNLANYGEIPTGRRILEGSRFCIDKNLSTSERVQVAGELVLAYLEYGLDHDIEKIIGLMYPIYWHNLFVKNGWMPFWLGDVHKTLDGKKARAGGVIVSEENLINVRNALKISNKIISYGDKNEHYKAA